MMWRRLSSSWSALEARTSMEWSRLNSVREDAFCPKFSITWGNQFCVGDWPNAAEAVSTTNRQRGEGLTIGPRLRRRSMKRNTARKYEPALARLVADREFIFLRPLRNPRRV